MALPSNPLYGAPTRITADGAVSANPGTLWALKLVGGSANSAIELTNDATGEGTNLYETKCLANSCAPFEDFASVGGIRFSSKCYADITGTGAVAYAWYAEG